MRDEVLARRDRAKADLDVFIAASDADLAPLLHQALQAPIADYEVLKAKAGRLDFLDLLIKARDLICDNAGVRRDLQQRFTHFFVDEFQDTDPLQAEILLLLAADDHGCTNWRAVRPIPSKLFLVGDPKQSIYRFRRADVALYEEVKERLLSVGAELLHLTTSFRSPPSIQSFVNGAFAPAMAARPDTGQAAYVPLPLGSEALWLRRPVSFHPQQRGQDFSRQTVTTLQQMAPLGLRRGRLGCHRLLGLLRGLLQTQASPWQEAQPRHPGHGASDGSNHLAALDAAPGLHKRC